MPRSGADREAGDRDNGEPVGEWRLDEQALVDWGEAIGRMAAAPMVLALSGDLGSGKTTLARAIARGAGVTGSIPSPTYNLMFRYPTDRGMEIAHLDLYRLENPDDVWSLGWGELPDENEMVIIEWPERARAYLPPTRWNVSLTVEDDAGERLVELSAAGSPPSIPFPRRRR